MSSTVIAFVVLFIGLAACLTDLTTRRIPNAMTFGGALAAVAYHAWAEGADGLVFAAAGWTVGVGFFLFPFLLGGLGGGDVKLVAALGAWLGPSEALWLALYSCVAGGVLAVAVALASGYLRTALANVSLLLTHWRISGFIRLQEVSLEGSTGPRLAYAVPIFVGTVVTLWLR